MDVRSLLKVMVDREASDLYLTVDAPPIYRIHGSTQPTDAPPFGNEQLEALAFALMRGQQRGEFEEKMEMNLALYYKESGSFPRQHLQATGQCRLSLPAYQSGDSDRRAVGTPSDHQRYRDDQTRPGIGGRGNRVG